MKLAPKVATSPTSYSAPTVHARDSPIAFFASTEPSSSDVSAGGGVTPGAIEASVGARSTLSLVVRRVTATTGPAPKRQPARGRKPIDGVTYTVASSMFTR